MIWREVCAAAERPGTRQSRQPTEEKPMRNLCIALICTGMLTACGGGGGGGSGNVSVDDIRILTGSQPPLEQAGEPSGRSAEIVSRADSLIISTSYGETSLPDVPTFRIRSTCSGTRCILREPQSGFYDILTIRDLEFRPATSRAVLSKHGITLFDAKDGESRGYGSWMDHSGFQIGTFHGVFDGETLRLRRSIVGGDLSNSRPNGSATWQGLMVGTPATGSNRGNFLQGDAALTYKFTGTIDAAFTNIKNIDRRRDHSVPTVRFINVPVSSGGTFQAGLTGNRIQGGFYGSGHAEAAGIFEQSNIVGAFGAKR